MAALRSMPQQQLAAVVERNKADMEIVQIWLLRDESDDIAIGEMSLVGQKYSARDYVD
jgi:hypothetical protein